MACLFCNSENIEDSPYEDTLFNNKRFQYLKCADCKLVYVHPLPEAEDFDAMYPTTYQGRLYTVADGCYDWLFKDVNDLGRYETVLDYGCGNGKFVTEALSKGHKVTGVEYNPDFVNILRKNIFNVDLLTIDEFWERRQLFDIIFLGNVLEHLTNPIEIINKLKQKLNPDGLLILEGPVEDNFTIAGRIRKIFFNERKKKGKTVGHAPRHIFYSNYKNQLFVFENAGFKTLKYILQEHSWPFPGSMGDCRSAKDVIFFGIGKLSIFLDLFIPKSGNKFVYIGRSAK